MLTDKQRQKIINKLAAEPSDNKLADKFGISRTTVWRIRQEEIQRLAKLKRALAREKAKEANKMKVKKDPVSTISEQDPSTPAPEAAAPPPPAVVRPIVIDDVTPKVDAEPVVMATYFAAQLLRCESVKDVANSIMERAEATGMLFRKLQVMDCISVGTTAFVRFRSDLKDISAVLGGSTRGFIAFSDGAYRITFADGRQGIKYPTTIMLSVPKAGFGHTYAGPKVRRWAQQFAPAN